MLTELTCLGFTGAVAADTPAPGGGSVSAYVGACGAALVEMVCRLSLRGRNDTANPFDQLLVLAGERKKVLEGLVDEDTEAFNRIMLAIKMPKGTPEEKDQRKSALTEATFYAAGVPLQTAAACAGLLERSVFLLEEGNQNALSDAAVALECLHAGFRGACYNVRINLNGLAPSERRDGMLAELKGIEKKVAECYHKALDLLAEKGL